MDRSLRTARGACRGTHRGKALWLVVALAIGACSPGAAPASPPPSLELPRDVPMAGAGFPGAPPVFRAPPGGSAAVAANPRSAGNVYTLRRANGTLYAEAQVDPSGRTVVATWFDDQGEVDIVTTQVFPDAISSQSSYRTGESLTSVSQSHTPSRSSRPLASCGEAYWYGNPYQLNPSVTFSWRFNAGSTPSYMNVDTTETYLRNAHIEWYNNQNWCGIPDQSVFAMAYGGRTTVTYGNNGINTVGFGNMGATGCASDVLGCTWVDVSAGIVTESDTRLNQNSPWINGQASGKYDTWSVMAHELGHTLGFDHVDSPSNVMNPTIPSNNISNQKLGKGDANGNNTKY
jgi:hypothetical protein